MDMRQIGLLVLTLILVLLNGFFVAAEFAIVKVRATRMEELASKGSRAARMVQKTLDNRIAFLSATQLGITLASLALGSVGEPAVERLFHPLFGPLPAAIAGTVSIVVSFTLITFFQVLFGELVPKTLAVQKTETTALAVSYPMSLFGKLLYPIIWVINGSARLVLRALHLPAMTENEIAHSPEELGMIIAASEEKGLLEETPAYIADHALELGDIKAREVMTPRRDIVFLSTAKTREENLEIVRNTHYTRYPVCDGDIDDVVGRVHVRELFMQAERKQGTLHDICEPVLIIPENKALDTLLHEFKAQRIYMAVVRDEYGNVSGLVTLEDVLEELVGEIQDELDSGPAEVVEMPGGALDVDGHVSMGRLMRDYAAGEDIEGIDTIGGFVLSTHDGLPTVGYKTALGDWQIEVTRTDGPTVARVRMTRIPRPDEAEPRD